VTKEVLRIYDKLFFKTTIKWANFEKKKNILTHLECLHQFIFISASLSCVMVAITWEERRSVGTIFALRMLHYCFTKTHMEYALRMFIFSGKERKTTREFSTMFESK
jgi:hypothetical protein